jgi:hypothetical protein
MSINSINSINKKENKQKEGENQESQNQNKITKIYKLGHCPELAVEEFLYLTKTKPEQVQVENSFLTTGIDTDLDVNITGSLVWSGTVLSQLPSDADGTKIREEVLAVLQNYVSKKIGLFGKVELLGRSAMADLKTGRA